MMLTVEGVGKMTNIATFRDEAHLSIKEAEKKEVEATKK